MSEMERNFHGVMSRVYETQSCTIAADYLKLMIDDYSGVDDTIPFCQPHIGINDIGMDVLSPPL